MRVRTGRGRVESASLGLTPEGRDNRLQGGDNGRVRQDGAGPGSDCGMSDGERSTASKDCVDAIQKIEAQAAQ